MASINLDTVMKSFNAGVEKGLGYGYDILKRAGEIIQADDRISDHDKQLALDDIRKALNEAEGE